MNIFEPYREELKQWIKSKVIPSNEELQRRLTTYWNDNIKHPSRPKANIYCGSCRNEALQSMYNVIKEKMFATTKKTAEKTTKKVTKKTNNGNKRKKK